MPTHPFNWYFGWSSVLMAFVTGAIIGLWFHKPGWLGGYDSLRRRMLRLGHIALAALGMMNVIYSLSPWPIYGTWQGWAASIGFAGGALFMPTVCFLTAWREPFRHLFFIPVISLLVGVIATLLGGGS